MKVFRLISEGTVEEMMYLRQVYKQVPQVHVHAKVWLVMFTTITLHNIVLHDFVCYYTAVSDSLHS